MAVVGACSTVAAFLAVTAATGTLLDRAHRLRLELLLPRPAGGGSTGWLQAEIAEVHTFLSAWDLLLGK